MASDKKPNFVGQILEGHEYYDSGCEEASHVLLHLEAWLRSQGWRATWVAGWIMDITLLQYRFSFGRHFTNTSTFFDRLDALER